MATERTFTLIGEFKDNITPSLTKLNASLVSLNSQFGKMQKMVRPIAKDMAIMAEASQRLTSSLDSQKKTWDTNTERLKSYREELARVSEEQKKLSRSVPHVSGVGGGAGGHGASGGGRHGGGHGGGGIKFHEIVGAELLTEAVIRGFEAGAKILERSFEFLKEAFHERVESQIEDIASAGGLYATLQAERAKGKPIAGFGDTIDDAMAYQRKINTDMAQLAAQLPGATIDYTNNARRLTDFMINIQSQDPQKFLTVVGKATGTLAKTNPEALEGSIKEVAKATTLMDQLAGGTGGAQSMTMVAEHIATQQKIHVQSLQQKYAMLQKNTAFIAALKRHEAELNKTTAGTAERMAVMIQIMREAIPAQQVNLLQRSIGGFTEGIRSAFLDPNTGMLGLSRQFDFMMPVFDSMTGKLKVVNGKIEMMHANFMQVIEDIVGNFGPILSQLLPAITDSFSPLKGITHFLLNFRAKTAQYFNEFQSITKYFENLGKGKDVQASMRAGLGVLLNILDAMGDLKKGQYDTILKNLENIKGGEKSAGLAGKQILNAIMGSKTMNFLLELMGRIAGSIVKGIGDGLVKLAEGVNKMASSGFMKGFQEAGGYQGFTEILSSIIKLLIKAIGEFLKVIVLTIGDMLKKGDIGGLLGLAGIVTIITLPFHGLIGTIIKTLLKLGKGFTGAEEVIAAEGARPSLVKGLPRLLLGKGGVKAAQAVRSSASNQARLLSQRLKSPFQQAYTSPIGPIEAGYQYPVTRVIQQSKLTGMAKFMKGALALGEKIPFLNIALGGLDFGLRKLSGERTSKALGGAGGSVVGGTLGAIVGSALGPVGTFLGGALGSWLGGWLGENLLPALVDGFNKIKQWFTSFNLGKAIGYALGMLQNTLDKMVIWFQSIPGKFNNWLQNVRVGAGDAIEKIRQFLSSPDTWSKLVSGAIDGVKGALGNVGNYVNNMISSIKAAYDEARSSAPGSAGSGGRPGYQTINGVRGWRSTSGDWTPLPAATRSRYAGGLGDAISSEMRNKPSGSSLVIANSSETIIPAAGGNGGGMVDFVRTMYSGFTSVVAALNKVQQTQEKNLVQVNQTLIVNQQQTNIGLGKLDTKLSAPRFSAPGMGSVGGVDSFTSMASSYGLTVTSGYRPGDPGWHGVNRARDYSNGSGPTPQMMAFARFLVSNFGSNLKELIYTPLGFSIKNGQTVPPYARAAHYNHVHVAYALGAGMPAFFSSQQDARDWERKATLGNVRVSSITSNSSEGFGGNMSVNAPITIHQQPGQSSEHLASLVAMELTNAIRQARSSSMYV